jgi:hypothetical protein
MTTYWTIQPESEWKDATAFIVGGGPSLRDVDLSVLKGQRVIAINSSYEAIPFADFLIFSDYRWWDHHQSRTGNFSGRIVCASRTPIDARLLMVRRKIPPGLDQPNDCLPVQFTSTTGAMALAIKLGAKKLVLLGIDGRNDADGKTHHHKSHPWQIVPGWEQKHRADLAKMVQPLKNLGIEVVLATPSVYEDLWPRAELSSLLLFQKVADDQAKEADIDKRTLGARGQHLSAAVRQEAV